MLGIREAHLAAKICISSYHKALEECGGEILRMMMINPLYLASFLMSDWSGTAKAG